MTGARTVVRTAAEIGNDERVERLSRASLRRVIEPEREITGPLTKAQVIPDELLSIADLDVDLTGAQRATLAREELASIARFGIQFEAVLMSGFAYWLALSTDVTDPRFTYVFSPDAEGQPQFVIEDQNGKQNQPARKQGPAK